MLRAAAKRISDLDKYSQQYQWIVVVYSW
jgi:hypothetical protein